MTMDSNDLFSAWTAGDSPWTAWAKPALFATMPVMAPAVLAKPGLPWLPSDRNTAIIIDLPGAEAVATGIALAAAGWRPVPLFNGCFGINTVVETLWAAPALAAAAAELARISLPADAPPVFLLDSNRMSGSALVAPGRFDNRWQVLPQDLPSGNRLAASGIKQALIVLEDRPIANDVCHVLRRWQEAGLAVARTRSDGETFPIDIPQPSGFHSVRYWLGVVFGLSRNSTGGFGSVVPEPSSASG